MAELRRYLLAHKRVLFRPQPKAYRGLSPVSSWFAERMRNASLLYLVHPARVPMLMRMLLCLLGASDPEIGPMSHLALGPHATGKSFCLAIITAWATPGQVEDVAHRSALADTCPGDFDGVIEVAHEANPKLFGVRRNGRASVTPEESRFKSRLTEGVVVARVCTPARGGRRSVTTHKRKCNGPLLANLNAKMDDVCPVVLSRFLVSDTNPDPTEAPPIRLAESICARAVDEAEKARDMATVRWVSNLCIIANQLIRVGALPAVSTPFTDYLLPRVLARARPTGCLHTGEARHLQRVKGAVRTLCLVRAILAVFGADLSPLAGHNPAKFRVAHFGLLAFHMTDSLDRGPSVLSLALGFLACQWPEDAGRWRTIEALSSLFVFGDVGEHEGLALVEDTVGCCIVAPPRPRDERVPEEQVQPGYGPEGGQPRVFGRAKRMRLGPAPHVQRVAGDGGSTSSTILALQDWAICRGAIPYLLLPAASRTPQNKSRLLLHRIIARIGATDTASRSAAPPESAAAAAKRRRARTASVSRAMNHLVATQSIGFRAGVGNSFDLLVKKAVLAAPGVFKGRVLESALTHELHAVGAMSGYNHVYGDHVLHQPASASTEGDDIVAGMRRAHLRSLVGSAAIEEDLADTLAGGPGRAMY